MTKKKNKKKKKQYAYVIAMAGHGVTNATVFAKNQSEAIKKAKSKLVVRRRDLIR